MVALQHVYVTAHGQWNTAPWTDERAQIGIRLACVSDDNVPAKGVPFTIFGGNGDIETDTGTTAGAHGILSRAWTARMGGVGSLFNMDADRQVDIAEDVWTFLNAVIGHQSNKFQWTHVKIAPLTASGAYGFTGAATYDFTTPLVGNNTSVPLPPEVALAVSMRAPISGRSGRGRMYLPGLGVPQVAANGTVLEVTRTALAASAKTFLNNLDDAPGVDEWGVIAMVTSAGKPTGVRPAQIRIGDHFDAQRRRQHQAVETYSQETL